MGSNRLMLVCIPKSFFFYLNRLDRCVGTDHQRIAKLERENEVAPPSKVSSECLAGLRATLPVAARCHLSYLTAFLVCFNRLCKTARMDLKLIGEDVRKKSMRKPRSPAGLRVRQGDTNPQILASSSVRWAVKLRGASSTEIVAGLALTLACPLPGTLTLGRS